MSEQFVASSSVETIVEIILICILSDAFMCFGVLSFSDMAVLFLLSLLI